MKRIPIAFALLLTIITLQGCALFSNVILEKDEVSGTSRSRSEFEYRAAREWSTPLMRINQTILKETGATGNVNVRIFDRIQLQANSFMLERRVYLIIDGKPHQVQLDYMDFERRTNIQEKRKDVLTADSSKISVVTGIDRNESNFYKLTYTLSPETIEALKQCQKLLFRYYAGPDMITTGMDRWELNTFKKLLEMS